MDDKKTRPEEKPSFNQVLDQVRQEYERTGGEIKEIEVLVRQSTTEVDRLSQRNAQIANRQRQIEATLETVPRQDIKETYTAAQEAQMRLFMMRGQLEQLQNKQQMLERHAAVLHTILDASGRGGPTIAAAAGDSSEKDESDSGSSIVRVINAQEAERQHLARQMHDGPAQSLTNLILQADICERLFDKDPARARSELTELKQAVNLTFQKVREFIFDLRPMMLDDLGLNPTLKRYVQDFQAKSGITCNLNLIGKEQRLPAHTEITVFRVLQGLLKNVRQHANAARVDITTQLDPTGLTVSVEDDGSGFNMNEVMANARQRRTMGIITMIEQVEMLGGEIHFDSAPSRGTKVQFRLPV
jgi:two-component system, NarL family, sensor histidine kinase DegS